MATLADINQTLLEQTTAFTEEQMQTQNRLDKLNKSINKMLGFRLDDLEGDIEDKSSNKPVKNAGVAAKSTSGGSGASGLFNMPSLAGLGAMLGGIPGAALVGSLLRFLPLKLILFTVGQVLADDIGKAVKNMTGSELLGSIAEGSAIGGAAGFLFGGVKGGIIGMIIGAVFSVGVREKIAETLSDMLDKEIKATDPETFVAAGALAGAALLLPKLIPVLLTKLVPILLAPKGLLVLAVLGLAGTAAKYFTDEEFRKEADKHLDPIRDAVSNMFSKITNAVSNYLNQFSIFDDAITTKEEEERVTKQLPQEVLDREKVLKEELSQFGAKSGALFEAAKKRLGDADLADLNPFGDESKNQSLQRVRTLAKKQGIDVENIPELAKITSAFDLAAAIQKYRDDVYGSKYRKELNEINARRQQISEDINDQDDIRSSNLNQLQSQLKVKQAVLDSIEKVRPGLRNEERIGKLRSDISLLNEQIAAKTGAGGITQQVIGGDTINQSSEVAITAPPPTALDDTSAAPQNQFRF